jgi:V/A-type H+-transporting ATPase subunit I
MPVTPMQKVVVFGHTQAKAKTVAFLQKNELIEIIPNPSSGTRIDGEPEWELDLAEVGGTIDYLDKIAGRKKNLIESFAPFKETVDEETLLQAAREFDWKELTKKVEVVETELTNLANLESKLKADIDLLLPWHSLSVPLNKLGHTKRTCCLTGFCRTKYLPLLQKNMADLSTMTQIEVIAVKKDQTYLVVFHLPEQERAVHDLLSNNSFEKVTLPSSGLTPAQEIVRAQEILKRAYLERQDYLQELKMLFRHRSQLTYIYNHLLQKSGEKAARQKIADTRSAFVLTGWVPADRIEKIRRGLPPLTGIRPIEPQAGEDPPTLLSNPRVLFPFELITRIFGLPAKGEIDPTGPLSFFYLLFFAMCLSDVGYGTLLSIAAYYYLRTLTLSEGGKKLLLLLFWGGIATVIVGVLTGSYFGMDLNLIPPPVGGVLKGLQVIDPIKNPLNVLIFSLFLGVVQNLSGIAIAMYWKLKDRKYLSAFLDDGLWIYFLSCLVLLITTIGLNSPLAGLFKALSIIGALLLVITQGRGEKGLVKKFLFGLLSLYRTTSYLGDTLSYSRLLALMMTTSIIGMVVNIIAALTRDSVPVLGYVFMAAILVIGHLFNLVVSTLGAFIHSVRLQLVEFFGKFYAGSGREWKPFRRETKYVIIK